MGELTQRSVSLTPENRALLQGVQRLHSYLRTEAGALRYILAKFALTSEGRRALALPRDGDDE